MRSIGSWVLALAVVCGTSAYAQQEVLTLNQARQTALERNINVLQAQNNVSSAQSGVLAAYGNYLPSLSASAGWTRSQNDRPGTSPVFLPNGQVIPGASGFSVNNNFQSGVSLDYTIFDGFNREAQMNLSTSNAVATEEAAARTRQSIVFQTEQYYLNVLRTEQLLKVAEENLKRDKQQLDRITELSKVGGLSRADVYRQQSQVAADEVLQITAQNNFDKAKADLQALIGLDVMQEYVVADSTIKMDISAEELDSTVAQYRNVAELTHQALNSRPDYRSASEGLSAAESGVTQARSSYFPAISAFAGYSLSNQELQRISDNKNMNWGLNLRWNIFDGFQTNQRVQSAIAGRRNAEINLVQTERNIGVDVKKALLDLDAARKQYEASQKGLQSASEDRKIAEERYNLGANTLLDLLVANANYVNAQANLVNAVYGFITARLQMEYALGERTY